MGILKKILTALRGGITEVGETIVDSQAERITDQEIRDNKEKIQKAKDQIASLMAQTKVDKNKQDSLDMKVSERETTIDKLLEKGDEVLAAELAEELELAIQEAEDHRQTILKNEKTIAELTATVKKCQQDIKRTETMASTLKAQKATNDAREMALNISSDLNSSSTGSHLNQMKEKIERDAAKIEAKAKLNDDLSSDSAMRRAQAALANDGSSALDRLKAKKAAEKEKAAKTE